MRGAGKRFENGRGNFCPVYGIGGVSGTDNWPKTPAKTAVFKVLTRRGRKTKRRGVLDERRIYRPKIGAGGWALFEAQGGNNPTYSDKQGADEGQRGKEVDTSAGMGGCATEDGWPEGGMDLPGSHTPTVSRIKGRKEIE